MLRYPNSGAVSTRLSVHTISSIVKIPVQCCERCANRLSSAAGCIWHFRVKESVSFPHRKGTLNFYDDKTHQSCPSYTGVLNVLKEEGLDIEFCSQMYRPLLLALAGILLEPISSVSKRVMPARSTWALYGFETIIWSKKDAWLTAQVPG